MRTIEMYCDGGARPTNPGTAANAFCVIENEELLDSDSEFHEHATNNQMELKAPINGLRLIASIFKQEPKESMPKKVLIHVDSQYVNKGISEWIFGWIKKGWKTASRKPVKNKDLWIDLLKASEKVQKIGIEVEFKWVKAHNGNKFNEMVDSMCTECITVNTKKNEQ